MKFSHTKIIGFALVLCCISLSVVSNNAYANDRPLNERMVEISGVVGELFPLIFSEETLTEAQNKKIYRSVERLKYLFKKVGPEIKKRSQTYQISYELIQDYLDAILYEKNPVSLAVIRQRLLTLSNFCISCHTQDQSFRLLSSGVERANIKSHLMKAEFNFATRNYQVAYNHYEKYLINSSALRNKDIIRILFRVISIYAQVLNRPDVAADKLASLSSMAKFNSEISSFIQEAIIALKEIAKEENLNTTELEFASLEKYAAKYLSNSRVGQGIIITSVGEKVERIWLRGVLFRYLNQSPKRSNMPYILYWLALCDLSIGLDYDYILADFYIKQCITRYPGHQFSQYCYDEYEQYVKFYYTTPTEPIIPFEINDELKALRKYLNK